MITLVIIATKCIFFTGQTSYMVYNNIFVRPPEPNAFVSKDKASLVLIFRSVIEHHSETQHEENRRRNDEIAEKKKYSDGSSQVLKFSKTQFFKTQNLIY